MSGRLCARLSVRSRMGILFRYNRISTHWFWAPASNARLSIAAGKDRFVLLCPLSLCCAKRLEGWQGVPCKFLIQEFMAPFRVHR